MDFSHATYFAGAQPYQFLGIPPLTPSHTNSVASTTSPPEVYEQFPNNGLPHDQFQNYDSYVQFDPQQTFPGPPTPPGAPGPSGPHTALQPVTSTAIPSQQAANLLAKAEAEEQSQRQGSNSEEDELTPAQSRRKAQNRAAQRAFRERKERHVKDLEARMQEMKQSQQQALAEVEQLRRDNQRLSTENEILRATSVNGNVGSPGSNAPPMTTGPMSYNPTDFYSNVLQNHANKTPSHRVVTSDDGERLLAAGATWDLIVNHELFKRGRVDIADVSERLKSQAKCDGQGPVFEERAILDAIEQSVASGSDELL